MAMAMLSQEPVPIGLNEPGKVRTAEILHCRPSPQLLHGAKVEGHENDAALQGPVEVNVSASRSQPAQQTQSASMAGAGSKRKRPLKLTPSQRERKRAIDREAQRSIRTKTKNYIAHLENVVKVLNERDSSAPEAEDHRVGQLVQELQHCQDELRTARDLAAGLQRIIGGGSLDGTPGSFDAALQSQCSNSTSPRSMSDSMDQRASYPTIFDRFGIQSARRSVPIPETINLARTSFQPRSLSTSSESAFLPSSDLPDPPAINPRHRRCDGEMFYYAEYCLNLALAAGPEAFTNASHEDEDIAVRAVLHGWNSVEDYHNLDTGWQCIRRIDQSVFSDAGVIERMANLRMIRLTMLHQVNTKSTSLRPIPSFMSRDATPVPKHSAIIDQFVWPRFRRYLYQAPAKYISTEFNEKFRHSEKFLWNFEISDAYTKDPLTQQYACVPEFVRRQLDIRCWTMKRSFFEGAEELLDAIPVFEPGVTRSISTSSMVIGPGRHPMQQASGRIVEEPETDQTELSQPAPVDARIVQNDVDVSPWLHHDAVAPQYWNFGSGVNQAYHPVGTVAATDTGYLT